MSSCFSRCLRVPIAMRRFYGQSLWTPQKFLLTNLDFHHGLLALSHAGQTQEAFNWLARAIHSNIGPILPETVDPKKYPREEEISDVRIMGYDAFETAVFPEVAGLRSWAGQDLTVSEFYPLGKIYIRGQKWMGDSYGVLFDPGHP